MIAFPGMLLEPAHRAGMETPPDDWDEDVASIREKYPHLYVFCKCQLGKPMRSASEAWTNAEVIAKLTPEEVKTVTIGQLVAKGFQE